MKNNRLIFVLVLLSGGLMLASGCALLNKYLHRVKPEAILPDATPPAGYNPLFFKTIKPVSEAGKSLTGGVFKSEVADNKVRIFFHIMDSAGIYYQGASEKKWKSLFCYTAETSGNTTTDIKNYTIREIKATDNLPIALALVMDHSGSMGDDRARIVQKAVKELIDRKRDCDAFTLIKYDYRVVTEVPLSRSKDSLNLLFKQNGLEELGYTTAVLNGIDAGLAQLRQAKGFDRKAVVIFTDGWDNSSTLDKRTVIDSARNAGIPVYAVDFGTNINPDYMKEIADSSFGAYYHIYGSEEFSLLFDDIYQRLMNCYVLEYTPAMFGQRLVNLRICFPKDTVEISQGINFKPQAGAKIELRVYFATARSDIKKESEVEVQRVADFLKRYPDIRVELAGHTDNVGNDNTNMKLSQARADAVKSMLTGLGISADRIVTKGYGETMPVASNDTEEGRALNRRTELTILGN